MPAWGVCSSPTSCTYEKRYRADQGISKFEGFSDPVFTEGEAGMDAFRKQVWTKPKDSKALTSIPCDLPLNQMAKDVLRGRNVLMFREPWFVRCKWPWHVYKKWAGYKRNPNSFFFFFLDRITKLMDGGSILVVKYLGLWVFWCSALWQLLAKWAQPSLN